MEEVMKKAKDGTIDREAAKAELEALEATMRAEIEALLTDEQIQKLEDMQAVMKQKMEEMRQAAHDAMVSALEMTPDQESGLETIKIESGEAQRGLIEKARAEDMSREDLQEALKQLIADRNSKIGALFSDKQIEIIKIYTALGMQYSKHCGDKRGDKGGNTGGSR
jgi:phage-related protein